MSEIKRFSTPELDRITSKLYHEFFSMNGDLFERNRSEYFYKARIYVERGLMEAKYFGREIT